MCNCTISSARFPGLVLFALILLVTCSSSTHAANDPEADSAIQSILTDGWKVGPVGLYSAQSTYRNLQASSRANSDVYYSYCLVMLKHQEYDEVVKLLQQKTQIEPRNLREWRSVIWVHLIKKEYSASLLFLDNMIKQIPKTELQGDDEEEVLKEIRFLGRLLAFLEGPVMDEVSKPHLKSVKDNLLKRLPGVRATEFDTNFQEVMMLYQKNAESFVNEKKKAKQEQAKLNEQTEIELLKKHNATEEEEIEEEQKQLNTNWSAFAKKLDSEIDSLTRDIKNQEDKLLVAGREFFSLQSKLKSLSEKIKKEEDQQKRDRLDSEDLKLRKLQSKHDTDGQVSFLKRERLIGLRKEKNNEGFAGQRILNRLQATIDYQKYKLAKENKRLKIKEDLNKQAATGNNAKTRVLSSRITSLRSYADFPLELERHELLALSRSLQEQGE